MSRVRAALFAVLGVFFLLHQDFWLWDDERLVLGLPVGMTYHVAYCVAATLVMALLVRYAWPAHLDEDEDARR